jgi:nucleoside-diphosphate-sugar epimerase
MIYVSTSNVYAPSDEVLDENAPCKPRTFYGETKYLADQAMLDAVYTRSLRGVILRPGAVFGPGAPGNLQKMIQLIRRGLLVEFSGGRNLKSMAPVENVLDAMLAVARDADVVNGEIFNVTGGAPLKLHDIGMRLAEGLNSSPRVVSLPKAPVLTLARGIDSLSRMFPISAPSVAQLVDTYASTSAFSEEKLRKRTSYVPSIKVEDALRAVVQGLDNQTQPHESR